MSSAKFIYSSLPNCKVVKNKEGVECLLLPIAENHIFKSDKGEYSQSVWINERPTQHSTHTAVIRVAQSVNQEVLKTATYKAADGTEKKALPTLMFLQIDGGTQNSQAPQQQSTSQVVEDEIF